MSGSLAGRTAEADALRGFLRSARDGQSPVVLITGEAGVGKTALAEHVLAEYAMPGHAGARPVLAGHAGTGQPETGPVLATAGALVLRGRATQYHLAAYQPIAGALRPLVASGPAAVPGILAVILPELGAPPADVSLPAVAEAVCAVLARGAGGGLAVLFIDDLQWADHATLDLIPVLADAIRGKQVLLAACYRSDELPRDHRLRQVRAELRRRQQLAEISLAPLDNAAVRAMLADLLGAEPEPGMTAAIAGRADGIPFAVQELAFALRDGGRLAYHGQAAGLAGAADATVPDGVREAVLLRTGRLPPPERLLLEAAAVAGTEFDVDVAAELAGLSAWSELLAGTGLVTEAAGTRAAFRHALTRDAVYADIPWSRRRDLHRRLASRLAAGGRDHGLVAAHLLAARDFGQARTALVAEAAVHLGVHAYRDAARALRGALDLWPPGDAEAQRLLAADRLAHCAEMCADYAEAVVLLRELADSSLRSGDHRGRAGAYRRQAMAHEMLGQWEAALAAREAAASAFATAGNPAEAAVERLAAAAHLRSAAAYSAALDLLIAARGDAEMSGRTDLLLRIDGLRGNILSRLGRPAEGIGVIRDALDQALVQVPAAALTGAAAELQQRLADALEHAGDYQAAAAAYASAFQFCDAHGNAAVGEVCRACATVVLFTRGDWDRAMGICADVLGSAASPPHARAVGSGMLGLILAWRGEPGRALPLLLESRSLATRIELTAVELLASWGLCVIDEAAGAHARAADRARLILARWQQTEERHYAIPILQWISAFFSEQGGTAEVRQCAAALSRIAELTAQPEALAALAHALGETALLDGGPGVAATELQRAVELFGPLGIPLAAATAQRRAAAVLIDTGSRRRGISLLRAACETAHRLRAGPLSARLQSALIALGEPAEHRARAGGTAGSRGTARRATAARAAPAGSVAGLSAREAEVMQLVAAGNTSREIGGLLFLSPRTVEMHVGSSMLKLDCRTRSAAVRRITELDLMAGFRGDSAAQRPG
jgi:DNA-binding CsgD family transcriptional regulator